MTFKPDFASRYSYYEKPNPLVDTRPHVYNTPGLDSLDFLRAVREDKTVPLNLRTRAAEALLPYESGDPSQYPYHPDPISTSPDLTKYYEGHLKIMREYYKKFPSPRKPPEFFFEINQIMANFHHQFPNKSHQHIEFYVHLLHIKRCYELSVKTGKIVNPDLEATEPEGHA